MAAYDLEFDSFPIELNSPYLEVNADCGDE